MAAAAAAADGERRIGVAMDYSESAKKALDWAIDNLLHHGDTLVVLHVLHHSGEETKHALWAKSGSRKHSHPYPYFTTQMLTPNSVCFDSSPSSWFIFVGSI